MLPEDITPLILCRNEQENMRRTLAQLRWAMEVVVLDSFSTDETLEICSEFFNVRLVQRAFDNHGAQWNFGLQECEIKTSWVLALDADYFVPKEFVEEVENLHPTEINVGYRASFLYSINGQILSGSLYPPSVVLFRRDKCSYLQDGHTQRLVFQGRIDKLSTRIVHDDRKPLTAWLSSQVGYADLEVDKLTGTPWKSLRVQDKLRRLIVVTPWLVPIYCLLFRKGLRDGRAGLAYALQRSIAESILALRLLGLNIQVKK